jgi:hypothetical protein
MKFIPILFSTPMVQAILDGKKTQTRRIVKPQPQDVTHYEDGTVVWHPNVIKSPYEVGDVLWVRETFFCTKYYEHTPLFKDKGKYVYKATENFIGLHKWKPSLFMPKKACRLFLHVKNIRVELLQDISEQDAIA